MRGKNPSLASVALVALLSSLSPAVAGDGFTVSQDEHGVEVQLDGKLITRYVIDQSNKPFFWPLHAAGGASMTRAYPMEEVEGERQDHPHHRSLWFGHQEMAGFDTWHEPMSFERLAKKPEEQKKRLSKLGATKHREFTEVSADGKSAVIASRNDYVDAHGKVLISDERRFTFHGEADRLVIDCEISLIGTSGGSRLDAAKDAGFSIRVPTSMDVDSKKGGRIVNSQGEVDKEAWGKRAKWCHYSGPVEGETRGIAILNHPSSFRFPTPWHVRTYGLFTANPFLEPALEEGGVRLKEGERVTLKHRLVLHRGEASSETIEAAWKDYAG